MIQAVETGLRRFEDILQKTDPFEMTFGEESYPWLTEVCRLYAREEGITVEQATGIVAVLSPMVSWRENLFAARNLIRSGGGDVPWARIPPKL